MAETFSCPMCGAPLTYMEGDGTIITCPYCHNSVIVPQDVRHVLPNEEMRLKLDEQLILDIRKLLSLNQKIEAIELVLQRTSLALAEAKQAVDEIEAGKRTSLADLYNTPLAPAEASPEGQVIAPQDEPITPLDSQSMKLFGIITVGSVVLPLVMFGMALLCGGGIVALIVIYNTYLAPH